MLRALETMKIVSRTTAAASEFSSCHRSLVVRGDIASRSFGVFTNANKVLLRQALGNVIFEKLLHSSEASPLGGEGVTGIHNRCQKFYNNTVVPHLLAGENVLVITHIGFLNVMAHVLSKRDVNEYKDFHIPNGKILSSKDLCDLMENAASSNNRTFEWFFNTLKTSSNEVQLISFLLGIMLKFIFGGDLDDFMFFALLTSCTMFGVFFDLLHVNLSRKIVFKVPIRVWILSVSSFLVRWIVFGSILWSIDKEEIEKHAIIVARWALLFMLPPSMSTIRESRCMGGDLYPSAVISTLMNGILPLMLIAYVHIISSTTTLVNIRSSFLVLLFVGFLCPCIAAHFMRKSNPIWSVNIRSNWSWLGDVSRLVVVSFLLGHRLVRGVRACVRACVRARSARI